VHDFFDIVGLSRSAPPSEVRRVCARLVRRAHPDFFSGRPTSGVRPSLSRMPSPARRDVAVDFVDMSMVLDHIQASFFRTPA
jgi:hypothetical protein